MVSFTYRKHHMHDAHTQQERTYAHTMLTQASEYSMGMYANSQAENESSRLAATVLQRVALHCKERL